MFNRKLASMSFNDDPSIFNSPVSHKYQSKHSKLSETLNYSCLSSTFNQFSSINKTPTDKTLTPQRTINDNLSKSNVDLSSFSKTLEMLNESEEDDAKEQEISKLTIFEAFFRVSKHLNDSAFALKLLNEFDQTCDDVLTVNIEMLSNRLRTDSETSYLERFSKLVRSERDTWKLFKMLYIDRIEVQGAERDAEDEMDIDEDLRLRLSDEHLAQFNLQRNAALREIKLIVQWLEEINDENNDFDYSNEFIIESQIYWETTFKLLSKNESNPSRNDQFSNGFLSVKSNSNSDRKSPDLCKRMDPDAPFRTGCKIADDDVEDENRLFQCMFRLIRKGGVSDAQSIAEKAGYWWLSSALDGWRLYHDPNYHEKTEDEEGNLIDPNYSPEYSSAVKEISPQTGNPLRDLWKKHAWNYSNISGSNLYERALFAAFCGNRNILMPLCQNWKDRMWAYFRCSLEVSLEKLFRETAIDKPDLLPRNNEKLPDEFWENLLTAEEIFNELTERDSGDEDDYHREIVKLLILGRIDELVYLLFKWTDKIRKDRIERAEKKLNRSFSMSNISFNIKQNDNSEEKAKVVEPNLLRFFAHLAISLLQLKLINEPEMNENCLFIIEVYTEFLIEYKLIELVAHYSQFLPHERQVNAFASLLETIDNEEDRQICMEVAKQSQMNLPVLLSTVVERIQSNTQNRSIIRDENDSIMSRSKTSNLLTSQITSDDHKRINALNWLILDKDNPQYVELLRQVNTLIRAFLLDHKVDLAKETISKMPKDLIEKAYFQWKNNQAQVDASSNLSEDGSIDTATTNTDIDIENIAREYLCHRVFFDAKDAFDNWHRCLYQDRPQPPIEPKQMLKLSERVAHEQATKEYEQNCKFWLSDLEQEAENAWNKMIIFLQFPYGIWCDVEGLNTFEKVANQQMDINSNETNKDDSEYLNNILNTEENRNDEKMSSTSTNFNENNVRQFFENSLKRSEGRLNELPFVSTNTRIEQFINLRRIYINQFLILLTTIVKESKQTTKLCFEKCFDILNIAECNEFDDIITSEQMKDLIHKLHESISF